MKFAKRLIVIIMTLAVLLSLYVPAFAVGADREVRSNNVGNGSNPTDCFINVSNVVSEDKSGSTLVLTAAAPAKVSFIGTKNQVVYEESVTYYPDSIFVSNEKITLGKEKVDIPFEIQNKDVHAMTGEECFASGNYVTLTKAGIYSAYAVFGGYCNGFFGAWKKQFYIIVTPKATPTASTVLVNGNPISFDSYNVDDNNYFKLRDIAKILSGTGKQFEVTWDETNQAIKLVSGSAYTSVGGEMAAGDGTEKAAFHNFSDIFKDGNKVDLKAYTIKDNNYFKLRDLGQAFNFGVTWDEETNTIKIDTSTGYVA